MAGRCSGNYATVIKPGHPALKGVPHEGFCGWQFRRLMEGGAAVQLEAAVPFDPVIDIASSYKNARREAMLFEFRVGRGKLLVCTLHLRDDDPGAVWLKNRILSYAAGDDFSPAQALMPAQLERLCGGGTLDSGENENEAMNPNDLTV